MTPLYQECERVKETCAQLAIENAALTAHNAKLTGAVSALRGELNTTQTCLHEAEAVRERDVHHLKASIERLEGALTKQREDFNSALAASNAKFMLILGDKSAEDSINCTLAEMQANNPLSQAELRSEEREHEACAREELWARTESARCALNDTWRRDFDELREAIAQEIIGGEEGLAHTLKDAEAFKSAMEERAAVLEAAIKDKADDVQRALENKLVTLQSTLLRLDRQVREQASVLEESRSESSSRLRDAGEEASATESRVTALECRLQLVEREAAAAARRPSAAAAPEPFG